MAEEAAVLVPVGGIGGRGAPRGIGTIAEVDDESVGPVEGFDRREMLGL